MDLLRDGLDMLSAEVVLVLNKVGVLAYDLFGVGADAQQFDGDQRTLECIVVQKLLIEVAESAHLLIPVPTRSPSL